MFVSEISECVAIKSYEREPDVNPSEIGIFSPESSMAGWISNVARTEAIVIKAVLKAMCLPGQILSQGNQKVRVYDGRKTYRFPNPNAASSGSGTEQSRFPLASRKRSGWNKCGSGYSSSLCSMALE